MILIAPPIMAKLSVNTQSFNVKSELKAQIAPPEFYGAELFLNLQLSMRLFLPSE